MLACNAMNLQGQPDLARLIDWPGWNPAGARDSGRRNRAARLSRLRRRHETRATGGAAMDYLMSLFTSIGCSVESAATPAQQELLLTALKNHVSFSKLSDDELAKLVDAMQGALFPEGSDIIAQGAEGDYFYVVESGRASVIIDGERVGEYTEPGSSFGELALFSPEAKRAATIRAEEACCCWKLDRATFVRAIQLVAEDTAVLQDEILQAAIAQRTHA